MSWFAQNGCALLQLQGHGGAEEVTVAVEALGPVVEEALVVARVEEAALVVAAALGCTYNSSRACSSSRRSSSSTYLIFVMNATNIFV